MRKLIILIFWLLTAFGALGQVSGIFPRTTATGTNTYIASAPTGCVCTSYVDGGRYQVLFTNANTSTSVTLAIHTAGAKTIYNSMGTTLTVGEIGASDEKILIYSSALNGFRLVGGSGRVDDALTNGVTTRAPSQNAVFDALGLKADLASPTFTGTPFLPTGTTGVTQSAGNSTIALATTEFVTTADEQAGIYPLATASGTDTYTATVTPAFGSYATGQRFNIKFTNANTGPATININSKGAKSILKNGSAALVAGDIAAGQVLFLQYDGANMQVIGAENINVRRVYNVRAYGAVADGITDNTWAIQTAIQACVDGGGGTVYFPNGIYIIGGGLITSLNGVNPNCQLYIPLNSVPGDRIVIKLLGESPVTMNQGPFASVTEYSPITGVILKSTITGSGTIPSVLGTSHVYNGFVDINRNGLILENISIQVKSKSGLSHIAPTMTAFNLYNMGWVQAHNCTAFTESPVFDSVEPSVVTYGFRFPQQASNSNYGSLYGFCLAQGFYTGFHYEEHDVFNHLTAVGCVRGHEFYGVGNGNMLTGVRAFSLACKYGFAFKGSPYVTVAQAHVERYSNEDGVKWYAYTADFLADAVSGARGIINYAVQAGAGAFPTPVFSGTWNAELVFRNDLATDAFKFQSGQTFTGGYIYDQLRYTGAAVSDNTVIPDRIIVHKQNGTAHAVGRSIYVNEQSTAADKRIVQQTALTNGSTSKGLFRTSINSGTALASIQDITTDYVNYTVPVRLPSYTVAALPNAATAGAGALIFVTNESGGAVIAFSDGTNWRRVTDRAIVS